MQAHHLTSLSAVDANVTYCLRTGETHERVPQLGHLASFRPTGRWGMRAA